MDQTITKIRAAVHSLFSNHNLQLSITDYDIDYTAYLVDCMSSDICSQEKMALLDQIKFAKRLSRKRNLLNDGDFRLSNWSDENGWRRNAHVIFASDYQGRYANMPAATTAENGTIVPTYLYQQVSESKLKPYTQYLVRGVVENSQDLEVFVLRYAKEVSKKINILNDNSYPNLLHTNRDGHQCYERYPKQIMIQNSIDRYKKPHEFTYHIDIGELNLNEGPGVCVGFKIRTTDGIATLANIEMVEVQPLKGDALARIKKREQKWKQKWIEKRMKIEEAVQVAQDAIQHLFTCPQQNRLKWTTSLTDIEYAETLISKIPYSYDQLSLGEFPMLPREAYDILQQLSAAVTKAQALYAQRNIVRNGNFRDELSNWNATGGIEVQPSQNTPSMLVIKDWSASISQDVCVNPEHSYLLRVTARKEGLGKGYVTISDCMENNTETMIFVSDEEKMVSTESLRDTTIESARIGETLDTGSPNRNYPSESFGFTPYDDQNQMMNQSPNQYEMNVYSNNVNTTNGHELGCGCRTNAHSSECKSMYTSSNHDERNAYLTNGNSITTNETILSSSPIPVQNSSFLSGYVMKTVEIFPETNRVRIEIGETEGTFIVNSVELIQIEQINEMNNQSVDVQNVAYDTTITQSNPVSFTEISASPRHTHYAYSHDSNIGYENPNWMADIPDDTMFSDLSIPGTHNTMALYGGDVTQCQTMSLNTQLYAGVRYLDIRCRHIENVFAIHHGPVYQNAMFGDVCIIVRDFLRKNPSETVFMRIKEEHTPENNTRSFSETFADYKSQYSELFWNWSSDNPKLSGIRGKVVVLQNFSGDRFGISYNTLNIQDQYSLNTNWDLYDKWLFVKDHLYAADASYKNGRKQAYLNYLSGSGGSFPYFVASGHSSPGTNASRLSTGLTTPAFASWYPDFPRVNCFIGICTIAFEGTNILTSNWIEGSDFKYVGIIAADFPGGGLIDNIIYLNIGKGTVQDGTYQIITALNNSSVVNLDLNQPHDNVVLWNNNFSNNQKWKFIYDTTKSAYQIKSVLNENLVLTWAYDSGDRDNVVATSNQYKTSQYWKLKYIGGNYRFINLVDLEGALDVNNGNTGNGTHLLYWNFQNSSNQKFRLIDTSKGIIQDGIYQIVTALNNSSVVDMNPADKNVHLWQNGNANNQKWRFVYDTSKGAYQIRNLSNENLVLAWNDFQGSNNVFATLNLFYDEHFWIIESSGDGYFYLRNRKNVNKVLDITNGSSANGTNIIVWNYQGSNNQKFRLQQLN
ncbi:MULTISPECIES: phosphatidylinositol-specific phospholipase C domain-containing protein [Bacillus cereus group]|uniref:phosphatidylinositol-specific phospholipase C domain-containing protein n=1 Tax=Bacillus TaxID=1386 RepID=UPI0001A1C7E8|nr:MULTISPECIES: phosphatidylinositol-specific phospholipase C domain-containing protein [Bacillus cereus group]EEM68354.1 hypothetical protein bthur0009_56310 [Bacillus thuringiensis serovar andalousiensis BGSC 4AW1]MEB9631789.1 phosphatidylinositol-specific phospholipase C domain-containing protein [Bacillus anthracis]